MQLELLALYAGPDQVMGVTSGLAGLLGLLLIFWNKLVATFFKVVEKFRPAAVPATAEIEKTTPTETP
ncbi:MAG: hypothetical protein LAN63_01005 [Acidobacteriia bacterium]|nr:hypothetical protein [Terriglobia bacterium]